MHRLSLAALLVVGLLTAPALGVTPAAAQQVTLLAAREIPRGAVIEAADVDGTDAAAADTEAVVGWVAKRLIRAGETLQAPAIAPADLVRSGDPVELVWREGSLEIRMSGRAMGSATAGERVLVRVDTQRRFEGIAEAPGVVRLNKLEKS